MAGEPMPFGNYPLPMTPPEFGSDHDSPRLVEPVYSHVHMSQQMSQSQPSSERQHTTSGVRCFTSLLAHRMLTHTQRRRAQNRAAQRAFRERKEKHARDLEAQLSVLTDKYTKLETSYSELNAAYEKLRKTNELLTQHGDDEDDDDDGKESRRRSSNQETLRKLLEILHGDVKGIQIKSEIS